MDSRERTFLAIQHREPDRVPIDCWISSAMSKKVEAGSGMSYEQLLDHYDVDLRYLEGPRYIGPGLNRDRRYAETDIWGIPRKIVNIYLDDGRAKYQESYKEVVHSPLREMRSVDEILDYEHWPSPDWFDYSDIERQCQRIRDAGRVVVFMGDRLNRIAQLKPAMYLRGFDQILVDLKESPEIARTIFGKIVDFYLRYGERILESARGKIDILCTGDDFGFQNGPLIAPATWVDFLKDGFREYVRLGKSFASLVMHHSCGSIYPLIDQMIDCGLDILQSLQPEAAGMDPRVLKQEFGGRLSFQGGISIQKILPYGSTGEVRQHVRAVMEAMAPGGGYLACTSHNIQADMPLENFNSLFQSYQEYGWYR